MAAVDADDRPRRGRAHLSADPIATWHRLLAETGNPDLCEDLAGRMRDARLTFGGRLLCPFLRPFFLSMADAARVKHAAETLWQLGERVAKHAVADGAMLEHLGLSDAEIRLAQIDPGYDTASTAARADAFLLPGSLQFAEYNAESPAGPGYTQRLSELFDNEPVMERFKETFDVHFYTPIPELLQALLDSYRDWGGTEDPPRIAIVDWREVPTWSEFELLRDAFTSAGVPTIVADPRDVVFDGKVLWAEGEPVHLVYRRVLINDIVARPDECRALIDAYAARAVCVANTLRCKIAHKKSFFAVLTDERYADLFSAAERDLIAEHVPWTRLVHEDLADDIRARRDRLVLKPNDEYGGTGVTLGWESNEQTWDATIERALRDYETTNRAWIVQERINVRREIFPVCRDNAITERDMLVDFAPYLFRGRLAGFLTRLSATGLANVTSGGGQVPSFVVEAKD
jgi:uncharacterized circularly permuted ATP-grasp superfamily protein